MPDPRDQRVERSLDEHRQALRTLFPVPPARKRHAVVRKATAGAALLVLLGAGLWWMNPAYRTEQWVSGVGEVRRFVLADGSQLTLDTASQVRLQWRLRSREVSLQQGRVHVDVAHARWRPFLVAAGPVAVRVLGTRFDVWRQPALTRVSVQAGVVAVGPADGSAAPRPGDRWGAEAGLRLRAGQQLAIRHGLDAAAWQALQPEPADAVSSTAWQRGQLVFDNTPLLDAIAQIQRYRPAPIRVLGTPGSAMPVSGVFRTDHTDELLDQLGQVLPIQVKRRADGSAEIRLR